MSLWGRGGVVIVLAYPHPARSSRLYFVVTVAFLLASGAAHRKTQLCLFRVRGTHQETTCSDLRLKSVRPVFIHGFQPTLAATSDGLKPTIPANEPAFIRIGLHFIFTSSQ